MTKQYLTINILLIIFLIVSCKKSLNEKTDLNKLKVKDQVEKKQNTLSDHETKLYNKGVNFYARGHEPSWSLYMDFESNFRFKAEDGKEMYVPSVQGDKAMDANVTRFYAEVEKGTLIISIQKEYCQGSMADKAFDFSVRVQLKYGIDKDFKEYSGCGDFLPDLSLHDIWVLEEVNGEPLSLRAEQERPRFEFFSKKGEVSGHTGCNNFKTQFSISGYKEMSIKPARMNRKSCPDMTYEDMLTNHVFGRRLKYSKENLTLNLTGYDGSNFKFKKVD